MDTQDAAISIVANLKDADPGTKRIALVGARFWTSEEIVALCERLSGQTAKKIYIPGFLLSILSRFLRSFEFTWNIADRLQFSELNTNSKNPINGLTEVSWEFERLSLENYLQEYFGKIMKKLKETNYQQTQNNEISFL